MEKNELSQVVSDAVYLSHKAKEASNKAKSAAVEANDAALLAAKASYKANKQAREAEEKMEREIEEARKLREDKERKEREQKDREKEIEIARLAIEKAKENRKAIVMVSLIVALIVVVAMILFFVKEQQNQVVEEQFAKQRQQKVSQSYEQRRQEIEHLNATSALQREQVKLAKEQRIKEQVEDVTNAPNIVTTLRGGDYGGLGSDKSLKQNNLESDLSGWQRLQIGMDTSEVESLLGKPVDMDERAYIRTLKWDYRPGKVVFEVPGTKKGLYRVVRWTSP